MPTKWTPREIRNMMLLSTSCLCLLVFFLGIMYGILTKSIPLEALGKIEGPSIGTGILGLALILYWIIKLTYAGDKK